MAPIRSTAAPAMTASSAASATTCSSAAPARQHARRRWQRRLFRRFRRRSVFEATAPETASTRCLTSVSDSVVAQFVENMRLLDTGSINAVGYNPANVLTGNAGNNRLDGRAGADAMAGQAGNDIYFVDNPLDRVSEGSGQGTDLVYFFRLQGLSHPVHRAHHTVGAAHINTAGNFLANTMVGNNAQTPSTAGPARDPHRQRRQPLLRLLDRARGGQHRFAFRLLQHGRRRRQDRSQHFESFRALREGPLTSGAFQRNTTGLAIRGR